MSLFLKFKTLSLFFSIFLLLMPLAVIYFIELPSVLFLHYFSTLIICVFSLTIGLLFSIFLIYFSQKYLLFQSISSFIFIMLQAIPFVVLAPLFVIYFGFTLYSKILLVSFILSLPIFIYVNKSLSFMPSSFFILKKELDLPFFQSFFKIDFYYSLPFLFSALKTSLIYLTSTVLFVEWIGSYYGLGVYLSRVLSSFNAVGILYVLLFVLCLTGFLLFLLKYAEIKFIYWRS